MKATSLLAVLLLPLCPASAHAQVAVQAEMLYPMTGDLRPIENGVVLCGKNGRIEKVGPPGEVPIPEGYRILKAKVATPGFIDAHATVGLSGILNIDRQDQEQLEKSAPIQPELRAIDAYNGRDPLVKWVRELGITTVHTGHAPGALMAGQTMILKTNVTAITNAEKDTLRPFAMVAGTLGPDGFGGGGKSPGSRAKSLAMLREQLFKVQGTSGKERNLRKAKLPSPTCDWMPSRRFSKERFPCSSRLNGITTLLPLFVSRRNSDSALSSTELPKPTCCLRKSKRQGFPCSCTQPWLDPTEKGKT